MMRALDHVWSLNANAREPGVGNSASRVRLRARQGPTRYIPGFLRIVNVRKIYLNQIFVTAWFCRSASLKH